MLWCSATYLPEVNPTVSPFLGFVPELQKFSVVLQDQSDPKAVFNLGHLACVSGIFLPGDFHIFENFKLLFKVNFADEMKAGQDQIRNRRCWLSHITLLFHDSLFYRDH